MSGGAAVTIESLAHDLHETIREKVSNFKEWDDLDDATRAVFSEQARYLLDRFDIIDRVAAGLGLFRCAARTELKEKVPEVSDETLLYLNHAITLAYSLGRNGNPLTEKECCGSCSEPGVLLDPEERA